MLASRLSIIRLLVVLVASLIVASPAAAVKRRAFLTSGTGTGDLDTWIGSFGDGVLEMADTLCQMRAIQGGLPNALAYRAWISTSTTDAYCHVQGRSGKKASGCSSSPGTLPGGGPWYPVGSNLPVTGSLDDLVGARRQIISPIAVDEHGDPVPHFEWIWSGTKPDGTYAGKTCSDWTTNHAGTTGMAGKTYFTAEGWTALTWPPCSYQGRLLCLESGPSEEPPAQTWLPSAVAFVTSASGNGNLSTWPEAQGETGIEAGDRICRTLAEKAGLPAPESYLAWLSIPGEFAADRITFDGVFRRLDGRPIAIGHADLVGGFPRDSLHVDETGAYLTSGPWAVHTGSDSSGIGTAAHCDSWASTSLVATYGDPRSASASWSHLSGLSGTCSAARRLYCLQNAATLTDPKPGPLFADGFESGTTALWSATMP